MASSLYYMNWDYHLIKKALTSLSCKLNPKDDNLAAVRVTWKQNIVYFFSLLVNKKINASMDKHKDKNRDK